MAYIDQTLIFESDKLYYIEDGVERQVMMSWEDPIMKASADYVCEGGGDILEVGFGMGISAGYIQANSISSHTIVENHPQVIEKAKAWAADKPNVTIIEGDWFEVKDSLSTYDGIFHDTWADDNIEEFIPALNNLVKSGTRVSWWNDFTDVGPFHIDGTIYQVMNITPEDNTYFSNTLYYLPKKQF